MLAMTPPASAASGLSFGTPLIPQLPPQLSPTPPLPSLPPPRLPLCLSSSSLLLTTHHSKSISFSRQLFHVSQGKLPKQGRMLPAGEKFFCPREIETKAASGEAAAALKSFEAERGAEEGGTEAPLVVGCGGAGVDYLATVTSFPNPDDKIRTTDFQVQGGGNVGNALTAAARLGLGTRIFSKVADDATGEAILKEFHDDGIDTSHMIIARGGVSPFTYIIVDRETNTRTCIHTPGSPPLDSSELSSVAADELISGCQLAYFDARLTTCTVRIAERAVRRGIPLLLDAEKPREGLDELLNLSDYVVASGNFPMVWTGEATVGAALLAMAQRLPRLKTLIVTRGERGCIALQIARREGAQGGERLEADKAIARLAADVAAESTTSDGLVVKSATAEPCTIFSSSSEDKTADITGTLWVGSAVRLRPEEVVDTTGAGDAFIGAVLYGICMGISFSDTLKLGAVVAAAKCQAIGARTGLPRRSDIRVAQFLHDRVPA